MSLYKHFLIAASTALVSTFTIAGGLVLEEVAKPKRGISLNHDETTGGTTHTLGYEMRSSTNEGGLAGSVDFVKFPSGSSKEDYGTIALSYYYGKRIPVSNEGNYSYGLMGAYDIYTDDAKAAADGNNYNPYVIGGYVGLAHTPGEIFEVYTRVLAVSLESKSGDKKREVELFSEGCAGIKMFF